MCKFSGIKPASAMKVNAWICAPATDRDLESGLSKSASVRTRKMVNYATWPFVFFFLFVLVFLFVLFSLFFFCSSFPGNSPTSMAQKWPKFFMVQKNIQKMREPKNGQNSKWGKTGHL